MYRSPGRAWFAPMPPTFAAQVNDDLRTEIVEECLDGGLVGEVGIARSGACTSLAPCVGQSVPYRTAEKSAAAGNQDPTVGQRFDGILLIALGHRFNVSAFRVAGCSQEVPPVKVAFPLLQCWNKVPGGTATAAVSLVRAVAQRGNVELVGIPASRCRLPTRVGGRG